MHGNMVHGEPSINQGEAPDTPPTLTTTNIEITLPISKELQTVQQELALARQQTQEIKALRRLSR